MTDAASDTGFEPEGWPFGLLTLIANVLDRAVLQGMALAFEKALVYPQEERARLRASVIPYTTALLERDPSVFFHFLDELSRDLRPETVARRPCADGTIATRVFPSDYVPFASGPAACPENATVWVEHWTHAHDRARATIVLLHGFTMGSPAFDARVMMAARWFALGLDVALVTLPYHGRRASAQCRYSGELFASWDVGQLSEAVRQSVHDVHLVVEWLRSRGRGPVGVLGVSLGGYATALLAALRDDLAFAIPVVPAVSLADLPFRLLERRLAGLEAPFTSDELERAYRIHSPLTYPLRTARQSVLIVGGRGDAVTPVSHVRRLWRHWGEPKAAWFSGGHVAAFRRSQMVGAIEAHLAELGLTDRQPAASGLRAA